MRRPHASEARMLRFRSATMSTQYSRCGQIRAQDPPVIVRGWEDTLSAQQVLA